MAINSFVLFLKHIKSANKQNGVKPNIILTFKFFTMKKRKFNTLLKLNKEVISKLNMSEISGGNLVPTEYNNESEQLTYDGPSGGCGEVCWNLGTRGLCTDEMATC